jgi:LysR substrate binding domain
MKSVWDIGSDLRAGKLKILMPEWRSPDVPVHALYQRSRYMAPRVRVLLDFLVERFSAVSHDLDVYLSSGTGVSEKSGAGENSSLEET